MVLLPVRDGQQQVVLLEGLHFAEGLRVQGDVAASGVVQQLLLGRVELTHLRHLLRGHQQQLGNGGGGRHRVAVHTMDLKGLGHVLQALVGHQDLLVTEEHPSGIFDYGRTTKKAKRISSA